MKMKFIKNTPTLSKVMFASASARMSQELIDEICDTWVSIQAAAEGIDYFRFLLTAHTDLYHLSVTSPPSLLAPSLIELCVCDDSMTRCRNPSSIDWPDAHTTS